MDASGNERPIIIKRVKKVSGGGHHGGAWKVAYADFVTAMMAFFMLMWLLNATTEKQRKGIADYFTPSISIARVSGGGDGSFGGDSVFTENTLARNGQGATMEHPTESNKARGVISADESRGEQEERFVEIENALMGRGGESMLEENELQHIITKVTDEGLVIELSDVGEQTLFVGETTKPTDLLRRLSHAIYGVTLAVTNEVAVEAHVAAMAVVVANNTIWSRSSERADAMRVLLNKAGMPETRINRVTGHADREPTEHDTMSSRNNRLEIILLRDQ